MDYLRITQNRSDKVLTLLREYFYKQNNLYRAVKVAENPKSVAEQDELVINAIADGLSIEAIDKSNGNIIAAVVTRILVSSPSYTSIASLIHRFFRHPTNIPSALTPKM